MYFNKNILLFFVRIVDLSASRIKLFYRWRFFTIHKQKNLFVFEFSIYSYWYYSMHFLLKIQINIAFVIAPSNCIMRYNFTHYSWINKNICVIIYRIGIAVIIDVTCFTFAISFNWILNRTWPSTRIRFYRRRSRTW